MIRTLGRYFRAFLRASHTKKWLALEAVWELLRARALTLLAARIYTRGLGDPAGSDQDVAPSLRGEAEQIGLIVAMVARMMPFKAKCLQQAIAVRRMLRRRSIPATVKLGLSLDGGTGHNGDRAAHAWVVTGGVIINGDFEIEKYAVVGRFY